MPNKILPSPTWHGSPGNLLPLYVSFLNRHSDMYGQQQIDAKQEAVYMAESLVNNQQRAVQVNAEAINTYKSSVQELQGTLVPFTDEYVLTQAYQSLTEIPEVIGTRVDASGALVVLLRPQPEGLDFGDFEFDFSLVNDDGLEANGFALIANRLPSVAKLDYGQFRRGGMDAAGLTRFTMYRTGSIQSYKTMLSEARLTDIIKEVLARFHSLAEYKVNQVRTDLPAEIEPTWEGYVFNPVGALARRLELCVNAATQRQIHRHEAVLSLKQAERPKIIEQLRAAQAKLRPIKAELEKAIRTFEQRESRIDTAQAAEELKFITTGIPGVMGIRFENNGTLVIHVRSSHQRGDMRYDLGDYELIMEPHPYESLGVIMMRRTRPPLGLSPRTSTVYWHEDPTWQWFCYGSRSTEMMELFTSGNFAQFTNIAVNTLNAFNVGHEPYLRDFPQIPVGEVWTNRPRNRVRRPILVNA